MPQKTHQRYKPNAIIALQGFYQLFCPLTPNSQNIEAEKALAVGMSEKAIEFVATGSEIYYGNVPDGAKHDH